MQLCHQYICKCDRTTCGIGDGIHRTERRIRPDDGPTLSRLLSRLCLEHGVTIVSSELYNENDSMVLKHLLTVVDVGVGKVKRAARRAADVGAGQTLCLVKGAQDKRLARAHAVHVDKGKGIVKAHGKRDALSSHIGSNLFHTLCRRERRLTAPHILVVQGQRHHIRLGDHALAEYLQEHLCTSVSRFHIIGTRPRCMRQLAAGRHEQELHIRRRGGLHRTRDIVHREIRRDKAEHNSGAARYIVKFAQPLRRQFAARKIGRLHIPTPYSTEVCKRCTYFRRLLTHRYLRRKGFRTDPICKRDLFLFLIPKQSEHIFSSPSVKVLNEIITRIYLRRKKR